jgi:hypothetical protein
MKKLTGPSVINSDVYFEQVLGKQKAVWINLAGDYTKRWAVIIRLGGFKKPKTEIKFSH